MHILVVDIGGTNVKIWKTGEEDKVKIPSGKDLTPQKLVKAACETISDWSYDRVSIGYPGHVVNGHPAVEPYNLGAGWVDFDYAAAFGCPVRIMNDACMQALGSYEGGRMFYLGLGTSVGTTLIFDGTIIPLALGHLKLRDDKALERMLNAKSLDADVKAWRRSVSEAAEMLQRAFLVDYVVIGGGNAKKLKEMPEGCRRGGNHNAYFGGLRMWEDASKIVPAPALNVVPPLDEVAI
jgi:hypothetical protein